MYITYERPRQLHDREIDPLAPDADLSPTGETCGETTYDVLGNLWTCTRRPHTESEHRAAYEYRVDGPRVRSPSRGRAIGASPPPDPPPQRQPRPRSPTPPPSGSAP